MRVRLWLHVSVLLMWPAVAEDEVSLLYRRSDVAALCATQGAVKAEMSTPPSPLLPVHGVRIQVWLSFRPPGVARR